MPRSIKDFFRLRKHKIAKGSTRVPTKKQSSSLVKQCTHFPSWKTDKLGKCKRYDRCLKRGTLGCPAIGGSD